MSLTKYKTYSIWGFEPRDEIIIKSYIRLLNPSLPAVFSHELFEFLPSSKVPSLLLVNYEIWQSKGQPFAPDNSSIIFVSEQENVSYGVNTVVKYPFEAGQLKQILTTWINKQTLFTKTQSELGSQATTTSFDFQLSSTKFHMLRWPSSSLLVNDTVKKVATALCVRDLTMRELAYLSGLGIEDCHQIVKAFILHGSVAKVDNTIVDRPIQNQTKLITKKPSVLHFIRKKLGLS